MKEKVPRSKGKRIFLKVLLGIGLLLTALGIFLFDNFNRLLSDSLLRTFNSNLISDVYELKFEKLRVNLIERSIRVENVTLQPREKPLQSYPYINSSFKLTTKEIHLVEVDLFDLINESKLEVEKISIIRPDILLYLDGEKHILFPYGDTTKRKEKVPKKKPIAGFKLSEFQLTGASFHGVNNRKENLFEFEEFSLALKSLSIDQQSSKDRLSFEHVELSLGKSKLDTKTTDLKHVILSEFRMSIDSLDVENTRDTLLYHFKDFKTRLSGLDIQTADSLNHISLGSFQFSYRDSSIKLRNVAFKPNISDAEIQKKFKYQKVNASGSIGTLEIRGINLDSLIYYRKVYIDEILLDSVTATVFKDKLKPVDTKRFPEYFGQDIQKIPIPLSIKSVKATHVTLFNTERKPDSSYAKVSINRGNALVENITNLKRDEPLVLKADAFIDNKVHFKMTLAFSYLRPHFSFNGGFGKFDLMNLNHLIKAYTPVSVHKGQVDEISFSGNAGHTHADGTMKFLYHDLLVDFELKHQQKWKNDLLTFTANSLLPTNNPSSSDQPPRVVEFHADRDMNKGFINIILKSVLNGFKETVMMSQENKKTHSKKRQRAKDQSTK